MSFKSKPQPIVFKNLSAAIGMAALLLAGGCANQATASDGSQPAACGGNETTTTLEGTGVGAAVGALGGVLFGHSASSALIGGAAGAAVGTGAGYLVANKNCGQAVTESNLQQEINTADAETQRYQEDANYYDSRAAYAEETVTRLQAEYNAGKLSAANYRAQMVTFQSTDNKLQAEIAELQASKQRLQEQADAAGPNGSQLQQEAQEQANTQQQLQADYNKFSNTLSEVPQG
jgi:hypothetical protein